jgi:hypothetical protein
MKSWRVIMDKDGNFYGDIDEIPKKYLHKRDENNSFPSCTTKVYQENGRKVIIPSKNVYIFHVEAPNQEYAAKVANTKRTNLIISKKWYSDYSSWKSKHYECA